MGSPSRFPLSAKLLRVAARVRDGGARAVVLTLVLSVVTASTASTSSGQSSGSFPVPADGTSRPRPARDATASPVPRRPSPPPRPAADLRARPRALRQESPRSSATPNRKQPERPPAARRAPPRPQGRAASVSHPFGSEARRDRAVDMLPRFDSAQGAGYGWRPPMLPYLDGQPVPRGYHVETRGGGLLMAAGGILWGSSYLGGLYAASNAGFENGTSWLVAPLVGPWVAIAQREIPCDSQNINVDCVDEAESEIVSYALLTGAGIFQMLGASLFLTGVSQRQDWLVRDDLTNVALVPLRFPQGAGLGAVGVF